MNSAVKYQHRLARESWKGRPCEWHRGRGASARLRRVPLWLPLFLAACGHVGPDGAARAEGVPRTVDAVAMEPQGAGPVDAVATGVVIARQPLFRAERVARAVVVHLLHPHRVLSSATVHGGLSEHHTALVNFQSMEARAHEAKWQERSELGRDGYQRRATRRLGLPPESTAVLGTAAHLGHLAHVSASYRTLRVDAFVTAGVSGNAVRASDAAQWMQGEDGNEFVPDKGTINMIVLVNQPMLPGAMVKALSVLVEGKGAALGELAVGSRYSTHLATGTGTDQVSLAAPTVGDRQPLESASQHLKLGQLLGEVARKGVLAALARQNGLHREQTRNLVHALGRFGLTEEGLAARLSGADKGSPQALLLENLAAVLREPRVAAAGYGLAAVYDRLQYGTLAPEAALEAVQDQLGGLAVAGAQRPECGWAFWRQLQVVSPDGQHLQTVSPDGQQPRLAGTSTDVLLGALVERVAQALQVGFAAKWHDRADQCGF